MDRLYSTGRYGVVDIFYRRIWLNTWSEPLAHSVRSVFRPHVPMMVVDLGCFENFNDSLVDSNVSLDWQIPHMKDDDPALVLQVKSTEHAVTIDRLSGHLINTKTISLLEDAQVQYLQQTMLFYLYIKIQLGDVKNFKSDSDQSRQYKIQYHEKIDDIFRTEIDLEKIKQRIYDLAENCFDDCIDYSAMTMSILGCLYG